MSKFRLYVGLIRDGKWFNYAEAHQVKGGTLTMLDSGDKSGAGRLLTLIKGSCSTLYTDEGEDYELKSNDYLDLKISDAWKIGYEEIKLVKGEEYPVIQENFFCEVCSKIRSERYTPVDESWQQLIDDGLIDEIYIDDKDCTFEVDLPDPIEIQANRTVAGGSFNKIIMAPVTIGDVIKIHKNSEAMATEANMIYASWDASIVEIPGLSARELNIIKRIPDSFFTKTYITTQANREAIEDAIDKNTAGIDASDRRVSCKFCGAEIGGYLDFTNFFSPLLPRKSSRHSM